MYILNGVCAGCEVGCKSCIGAKECVLCTANYSLYEKTCLVNCPAKTTSVLGRCEKCQVSNCQRCSNVKVCIECVGKYFLEGNSCVISCSIGLFETNLNNVSVCSKCGDKCTLCNSTSSCKQCLSGYLLYNNTCTNTCPVGTFGQNFLCRNCPVNCKRCQECKG